MPTLRSNARCTYKTDVFAGEITMYTIFQRGQTTQCMHYKSVVQYQMMHLDLGQYFGPPDFVTKLLTVQICELTQFTNKWAQIKVF